MKSILLATLLLLAPFATLHAADLQLTGKDIAPAPIVLYEGAPSRTRDAAVTLADYIEKISGSRPALIDGQPTPLPDRAIWVGVQPAARALFPEANLDFDHPEETLILANDHHLLIAGRDRWDPEHTEAEGRLSTKTDSQQ
jgi:hypothetical protein